MIAKKFTEFVLRSNNCAILIAVLCSILSSLGVLPSLLGWVSAVVVALVTLCKSVADGFIVLLWAALPYIVIAAHNRSWWLLLHSVVFGSLFVWVLALLWRLSKRFVLVVESAVMIGLVAVLIVHLILPNPHVWWVQYMVAHANKLINTANLNLDINLVKKIANMTAFYMTGMQSAIILFGAMLQVIIARLLQANLVNSWLWREEWLKFRLQRSMVVFLLLWLVFFWIDLTLLQDLLPVLIFPLFFAGISLGHSCIIKLHFSPIFIWSFYLLVFISLLFMPILLSVLVVAAIMDSFLDFRTRFLNIGVN